jgi:hypothetical protein
LLELKRMASLQMEMLRMLLRRERIASAQVSQHTTEPLHSSITSLQRPKIAKEEWMGERMPDRFAATSSGRMSKPSGKEMWTVVTGVEAGVAMAEVAHMAAHTVVEIAATGTAEAEAEMARIRLRQQLVRLLRSHRPPCVTASFLRASVNLERFVL